MKLKQIVCDKTDLNLTKEKETKVYGEIFTIEDEARAKEILNATFKGQPVVEIVADKIVIEDDAIIDGSKLQDNEVAIVEAKEVKSTPKKNKKNK